MIAFFIGSFLFGVIFSRAGLGPNAAWLDFLLGAGLAGGALSLACAPESRARRICLTSCAGLLWGMTHSGRVGLAEQGMGVVTMVSATSEHAGPLLIAMEDQIFEAYGPQRLGEIGSLSSRMSSGLLSPSRLTFHARFATGGSKMSWWRQVQRALQNKAQDALRHLAYVDRRLIGGIVFGSQEALPVPIREAFRRTGLYHLLVVSGLHVSLIASLLSLVLRAPLQGAYAFRLISPLTWRHVSSLLKVGSALGAMAYLSLTGASAAAQRSALFFVVGQLCPVFFGRIPLVSQMLWTALSQVLLFPLGFLAEGTFMSWAAYLVVVRRTFHGSGLLPVLQRAFWVQCELMVLVTAVFGQLVLLGLVTNLIFVAAFPVIVVASILTLFRPPAAVLGLALAFPRNYVDLVSLFARLCDVWPSFSVSGEDLPRWVRGLAWGFSVVFVLNAFRRLSIREEGGLYDGRKTLERTQNPDRG